MSSAPVSETSPATAPPSVGYPDEMVAAIEQRLAHEATPGLPAVPAKQVERRRFRASRGWPAPVTTIPIPYGVNATTNLVLEEDCPGCLAVAPAPMSRVCVEPGCDGQGRRLTREGRTLLDFVARRGGTR